MYFFLFYYKKKKKIQNKKTNRKKQQINGKMIYKLINVINRLKVKKTKQGRVMNKQKINL